MEKLKPSDLRIGNWIRERGRHYEFTVSSGTFSYMEINKDFFEPIPLTEEWLKMFGFVNLKYKSLTLSIIPFDKTYQIEYIGIRYINDIKILYVHQLQNIYFTFTGEELKTSATVAPIK